ncbi:MAG TPA: ThuA domain-containing protein [Solirubrobacteraceae bacterium]|nr:ThuA domain-containing protein [Solirubrobacteraceae bacterium]
MSGSIGKRARATLALSIVIAGVGAGRAEAAESSRVLVFSKTTAFRHGSIPTGIATIEQLGRRHGFRVERTENAARFTKRGLARYDALIFLSTTGDPLGRTSQKRALRRYVERGGGFFGIHAASDSTPGWRWYDGLVGARFRSHAAGAPPAVVRVARRRPAATRGLPAIWRRADEWYAFHTNPRERVRVLATVDERSYTPGDSSMGADHPIAWCQRYRGGRSVYTAMGHTSESYAEPLFRAHLLGSIRMAMGRARFDCP